MLVENGVEMLIRAANREQGIGIKFAGKSRKLHFTLIPTCVLLTYLST